MVNFRKMAAFVLVCTFAAPNVKAQLPDLPVDPDVRIGKLENGLTYYIRHNEEPKNQAAFFIAHKVGAVQEEDNQRGLAHFLEHMAFNGSKHFPAGDVFSFIQRIGVTAYNAQTGVDQTWYHLDNTPTVNPLVVDSCMLLLSDWSCQVELTQEEIEKERDVIHGEYRMSDNAQMRILERQLPVLYPGSRYAYRLPIGVMEVIDNFSPQFLKDYYTKWYHPDLQAVIVVGDIDVDYIEGKIKELFAPLKNPENEAAYELYPVPDNETAIYAIDKDPEQKQVSLTVNFKHEIFPFEQRGNAAYLVQNYILRGISHMLNERFAELSMKADCPFASASCYDGNYMISKTCDAFVLEITPKEGKDMEALAVVMNEVARAQQHGFTQSEVQRYVDEYLSRLETSFNNRNKQPNSYYTSQYLQHFLEGDAIPSIETEYEFMKAITAQLPAEAFNATFKQLTASTEKNFAVLAMYPEKEEVTIPTADQLKEVINTNIAAPMEAYVDAVNDEPLIAKLPKPVKIKKEEQDAFGFTKWTLKNGANVYFKKTDFKDDEITMRASSRGGFNALGDADAPVMSVFFNGRSAYPMFNLVVGSTGVGNLTAMELQKKMAGKQVGLDPSLSDDLETLSGFSTPKDLRTLFELTYLAFTGTANDPDAYNSLKSQLNMVLPQLDALHDVIQQDSVQNARYGNNARKRLIHADGLDKISYERIREIYGERFKSAGDFDFYFSGPINEDSLRAYVEQYIAPLAGQKKREDFADNKVKEVTGEVNNTYTCVMPNEESKEARITVQWLCEEPFTVKENVANGALGSILSDRYFNKIREENSMGYHAGAYGYSDLFKGGNKYVVRAVAAVKPDMKDAALKIIYEQLADIAANGVTEEELKKYREPAVTAYNESLRSDGFWISVLTDQKAWGQDTFTGKEEAIKSVGSADIQAFAKKLLKAGNRVSVVMIPE